MKKLAKITIVLLFTFLTASAQDSPYQKAMKTEIANLMDADSLPAYQKSTNAFARISALNPNEWQPYYYGALASIYQGLENELSSDKRDEILSKADELITKADAIAKNNAEIVALQGFVIMAKLNVDPSTRGQNLSGQVLQTFGKALTMDNKNPRTLALSAQMEFGMAKFFGSGTEKACGLAKQSLAIFATEDEAARKAALLPTWGKPLAEKLAKGCQ